MIDVDFHRGSSNEHDNESTLKETETQRNTNLRAIFWENQPTWNVTPSELAHSHIIGLKNLTKYFSHTTNISGFTALCFFSLKGKVGFSGFENKVFWEVF